MTKASTILGAILLASAGVVGAGTAEAMPLAPATLAVGAPIETVAMVTQTVTRRGPFGGVARRTVVRRGPLGGVVRRTVVGRPAVVTRTIVR